MPRSCPSSPGFATRMRGRPAIKSPSGSDKERCCYRRKTQISRSDRRYCVESDDLVDRGSFRPVADELVPTDPLAFPSYKETLESATNASGTDESVVAGPATVAGIDVEL